ncbi:hypothetical protein Dimus_014398 [Dionaea muscipula]
MAVEKGNGLWIKDKQLKVTMAASRRMRRPTQLPVLEKGDRSERVWLDGNGGQKIGEVGRGGHLDQGVKRSYSSVVRGTQTLQMEPRGPQYPVVTGDIGGVDWLQRSFNIVERALCRKEGLNIDAFMQAFEFKIKMARLGKLKWLMVFDREEDFEQPKLKGKSWWARWFDSAQLWKEETQVDASRDVWLRCFGVPLQAYCVNTLMAIGYVWGEVLGVDLFQDILSLLLG